MDKARQREEARRAVRELTKERRATFSSQACERAAALTAFKTAKTVLLYSATEDELDVSLLAEMAAREGKVVVYPCCVNGEIIPLVPVGSMKKGAFGIMEPDINTSERAVADLIVVPGLAFDKEKNRLGRGGGYYDRLLAQTSAHTLGIAFSVQVVQELVTERHDIKVETLVTDSFVIT